VTAALVGGKRSRLWAPVEEEARIVAAAIVSAGREWPDGIGPESFASGGHALVWREVERLRRRGSPIGVVEVGAAPLLAGKMGALVELVNTLDRVPAGRLDLVEDARVVRAAAARRRLAAKCDLWAGRLRHTDEPLSGLLEEAIAELDTLVGLAGDAGGV
jgi:hypothetical protein